MMLAWVTYLTGSSLTALLYLDDGGRVGTTTGEVEQRSPSLNAAIDVLHLTRTK